MIDFSDINMNGNLKKPKITFSELIQLLLVQGCCTNWLNRFSAIVLANLKIVLLYLAWLMEHKDL